MSAGENVREVEALLQEASTLYRVALGREIDQGARANLAERAVAEGDLGFKLALQLLFSTEFTNRLLSHATDAHLFLIHRARDLMVRRLLPSAKSIIDLGGINAPLFRMGYSHPFEKMVIVDLPADARHAMYRDLRFNASNPGVSIHYCDMTDLRDFADEQFDLVWSGQSIEHVDRAAAARMCREAWRVLRPGGDFCLDTPNRGITEIHTRSVGGGFVHPDHKHEYRAAELRDLLVASGFAIEAEKGICEMPRTRATRAFDYADFILGNPIADDPEDGYVLFFHCTKR